MLRDQLSVARQCVDSDMLYCVYSFLGILLLDFENSRLVVNLSGQVDLQKIISDEPCKAQGSKWRYPRIQVYYFDSRLILFKQTNSDQEDQDCLTGDSSTAETY